LLETRDREIALQPSEVLGRAPVGSVVGASESGASDRARSWTPRRAEGSVVGAEGGAGRIRAFTKGKKHGGLRMRKGLVRAAEVFGRKGAVKYTCPNCVG